MAGHRSARATGRSLAGALLAIGLLGPTGPAMSADPDRGRDLAERRCASCHVIDREGSGEAAERAPSFPDLAADETKSASYLRGFLTVPHYPQPDLKLDEEQIEDLVAHFETMMEQQPRQQQPRQ